MSLNVQLISTETIIPFSPTSLEKRTYKRSLLDQLTPTAEVDCVLFYPNALKMLPTAQIHDKLRLSLSKALAHYYPLAGRARDALSINCNDLGVSYTEARVHCDMASVILNIGAPSHPLLELIPKEELTYFADNDDRALLSVQASSFTCGGLAIGVKVTHAIADAAALASFLAHWAGISRDPASFSLDDCGEGTVVDCASVFPPRDLPLVQLRDLVSPEIARTERVVKRFVFDGYNIGSLREWFQDGRLSQHRITRYEALATLIWAAHVNILQDPLDKTSTKSHNACSALNMRKRVDPPLPGRSLGSTIQVAFAEWPMNKAVDLNEMAEKLSNSIRLRNDPNVVRDPYFIDKYLEAFQGVSENVAKDANLSIGFSSWCRFPFYETDFGWEKPKLVATSLPLYTPNLAIFIDAKDGEGIEVWLGLSKEDMAKFEEDPLILRYSSFGLSSTSS